MFLPSLSLSLLIFVFVFDDDDDDDDEDEDDIGMVAAPHKGHNRLLGMSSSHSGQWTRSTPVPLIFS